MSNTPWWLQGNEEAGEVTGSGIPIDVLNEVRQRDGNRCRCCGSADEDILQPHHVVFKSRADPEMVHSPSNVVTLCFRCHNEIHQHRIEVLAIRGHFFFSRIRRLRC